MIIKKVDINDIQNIHELDLKSFNKESYNLDDLRKYINDNNILFICVYENTVFIGYSIISLTKPEAEILKICINDDYKNKKYGYNIIKFVEDSLKCNGYNKIYLEVRESNKIAIIFYEKNGFIKYNTRNNYYKEPVENAILYVKYL